MCNEFYLHISFHTILYCFILYYSSTFIEIIPYI
nr:MAG TPA: hypothetical protein [Caudoviricetes sp.]